MRKQVELLKFNEESDSMAAFPIYIDGMSLMELRDKLDEYIDEYQTDNYEHDVKDLKFKYHYERRGHCSNCSEDYCWWTLEAEVDE